MKEKFKITIRPADIFDRISPTKSITGCFVGLMIYGIFMTLPFFILSAIFGEAAIGIYLGFVFLVGGTVFFFVSRKLIRKYRQRKKDLS